MPPSAAVLPLLALLAGCLSASSAAAPPPEPFGVTPLMLSRALLSNGSAENWQSVHARLASGVRSPVPSYGYCARFQPSRLLSRGSFRSAA